MVGDHQAGWGLPQALLLEETVGMVVVSGVVVDLRDAEAVGWGVEGTVVEEVVDSAPLAAGLVSRVALVGFWVKGEMVVEEGRAGMEVEEAVAVEAVEAGTGEVGERKD